MKDKAAASALAVIAVSLALFWSEIINADFSDENSPTLKILDEDAFYPEGPISIDGVLMYAEMHGRRISKIDENGKTVLWASRDCSPTSITDLTNDAVLVLCHVEGKLVKITLKENSVETTEVIHEVPYPNDSASDLNGGVYITLSGRYSNAYQPSGQLVHYSADGELSVLASGLRYPNGVTQYRNKLLVSEHLGRRILEYEIFAPGKLGTPSVFFDLGSRGADLPVPELAGPDGIAVDDDGFVYFCEYGTGRLFILDPRGAILRRLQTPTPLLTNVALSVNEEIIYLTGTFDHRADTAGRIFSMQNPRHAK